MSVDQPVEFEIVIVVAIRVYQDFCYFQPAHVKHELKSQISIICWLYILCTFSKPVPEGWWRMVRRHLWVNVLFWCTAVQGDRWRRRNKPPM
jgi:hypothetical protein